MRFERLFCAKVLLVDRCEVVVLRGKKRSAGVARARDGRDDADYFILFYFILSISLFLLIRKP
jgi:hypothetical protein